VARTAGDRELAAERFLRAVTAVEEQLGRLGGTEDQRAGYRASHMEVYRAAVAALLALDRPADAFQLLERSRARSFLAVLASRDLDFTADLPADLDHDRRRLAHEHDDLLGELAAPGNTPQRRAQLLERLDSVRRRLDEVRAEVRRVAPHLDELENPRPLDIEATRSALPEGMLLLSYMVGDERSFLFTLGPEHDRFRVVELGVTRDRLTDDVERLRRLIARGADGSSSETLADTAATLSTTLLAPVSEPLGRASRILVLPDGPLHLLPFAALPDPVDPASGRYLVERAPVVVASSATVWQQLDRHGPSASPARTVVAFGDPTLRRAPVDPTTQPQLWAAIRAGLRLEPLPGARAEVEAVARRFPDRATVWLGSAATEARAKALDPSAAIIHFACHGFADELQPLESSLALAAPADASGGEDNGLLQAWEVIEGLRIAAEVVVLSACDTALGQEVAGEGIVGLTRAFQFAGARSVVASLWGVADESTTQLMDRLYRGLAAGLDPADALRDAQLELLHAPLELVGPDGQTRRLDATHPFAWAGFEVFGRGDLSSAAR
jgi:CHAT domain-containing protein